MPDSRGRHRSATAWPARRYAPSMWNHSLSSRADARQRRQIVDRAGIDRAGGTDDQEGRQPGFAVLGDGLASSAATSMRWNWYRSGTSRSASLPRPAKSIALRHAAMRRRRRVGTQLRRPSMPMRARTFAQGFRARDQHGHEIGHRGAGDEQAAGALRGNPNKCAPIPRSGARPRSACDRGRRDWRSSPPPASPPACRQACRRHAPSP